MSVHPTADISPDCRVGEGTRIWHHVQIREGASVGSHCVLGKGVYVDSNVVIGNNCKLENGASVFSPAVLEDGVFLGPGVVVTNDRYPRAINPDGSRKQTADWHPEGVLIKYGAAVGAGSILLPGVTVGAWALVGAGTVVLNDVPDHALVAGNPAQVVGFVCACGTRFQLSPDQSDLRCPTCGSRLAR